jgi:hypothetical protein
VYELIELSSRFTTNSASPAGVIAIAMGPVPVATLWPTCEVPPVLKFIWYEATSWSPCVVTHIKPVVGVVMALFVQLFNATADNATNKADAKRGFMRIIPQSQVSSLQGFQSFKQTGVRLESLSFEHFETFLDERF